MKMATMLVLAAATWGGIALAQPDGVATRTDDGLVAVNSRLLDEVAVRPGIDLSAYRKVYLEPVRVELRKDWLKRLNETRGPSRWLTQGDAAEIADEAAAQLSAVVARVFRDRGYEIVPTPAAGVLRLSAAATDLDLYAPDTLTPGIQRYVVRDAGTATLRLDVHDGESGRVLAQVVDRGIASEVRLRNQATNVSNAFWFDALFQRWATACAEVLAGSGGAVAAVAAQ